MRRLATMLLTTLLAGACASTPSAGSASPTPAPALTPGPTATTAAAGTPTPTPAPAATPAPTQTPQADLTGSLGAGRQVHTATVLADGRVLIAGGYDNNDGALASAVLYQPATNTFSPTGSMAVARGLDTATLLADGRVLIAGGGPASWTGTRTYLASAELYDPKTGTFSPTGSMATSREDHTATLLLDGRVLIAGGNDVGNHAVVSAELYNPKSGTFSPTGSMRTTRGFHTATLLADGRVLIVGGNAGDWSFMGAIRMSAELYDPKTGTFSTTGSMAVGRAWHTATLLSDGRVLVAGGEYKGKDLASAEIYDPKTGSFRPTGPMSVGRIYHTATLLTDGRVLIAGGGSDYTRHRFLSSAELYDPKTGTFSTTGSLIEARTYDTASLLGDGRVLVAGGYGNLAPLASAEIYDPKTGSFARS